MSARAPLAQVRPELRPIELAALLENHAFDIDPVLRSSGKRLVDNEILGRAGAQCRTWYQLGVRGPLDGARFERHGTECDVDTEAVGRPQ